MFKTFSQTFSETNINAWMSQEKERLKKYKLYGGYSLIKTWTELAEEESIKNYFNIVKKYSLIREYGRQGFPIERIMEFNNFDKLTAKDIYRLIRTKSDRIFTIIDGEEESKIINEDLSGVVKSLLIQPSIGLPYPFELLNEFLNGISKQTFLCIGMPSNDGKSRFLMMLASYIALVLHKKVFIMMNEMTTEKMKHCLITTVLGNSFFKKLHGVDIYKNEKDIIRGIYRDENGEIVTRKIDKDGNYIESEDEFIERVTEISEDFRKVIQVSKWVEDEMDGLIYVKELSKYDDGVLEFEIKRHVLIHDIKYVFYDTLKNENIGDWASFKVSVTRLKELMNELNIYGYGSIQLLDEVHHLEPFDLTSNVIAEAKAIKQLLDQLILAKQISKDSYHKYQILHPSDPDWGGESVSDLDYNYMYYAFKVDKNRSGSKPLLAFRVDLDKNQWIEEGFLIKKIKDNR